MNINELTAWTLNCMNINEPIQEPGSILIRSHSRLWLCFIFGTIWIASVASDSVSLSAEKVRSTDSAGRRLGTNVWGRDVDGSGPRLEMTACSGCERLVADRWGTVDGGTWSSFMELLEICSSKSLIGGINDGCSLDECSLLESDRLDGLDDRSDKTGR